MQPGKQPRSRTRLSQDSPIAGSVAPPRDGQVNPADNSLCEASPSVSGTAEMPAKPSSGSTKPSEQPYQGSLRDEVREALRNVLNDKAASAAAKASAGRTLLEYFDDGEIASGRGRRASEMTVDELDAEIGRLTSLRK